MRYAMTIGMLLAATTLSFSQGAMNEGVRVQGKQEEGSCRSIALVVQEVFLPEFSDETAPDNKVVSRLDAAADFAPADDVLAACMGAVPAGRSAGYEFSPIAPVGKGQTPREVLRKAEGTHEAALLLRVSTRTMATGGAALVAVFADAALFRKSDMSPILNAGFIAMEKIDPKVILDGKKVPLDYWSTKVARMFGARLDSAVLSKMQAQLEGKQLVTALSAARGASSSGQLHVSTEVLDGTEAREPELAIARCKNLRNATVYLTGASQELPRRWFLGEPSSETCDSYLKPGKYTAYAVLPKTNASTAPSVLTCEFEAQGNHRYGISMDN